MISYSQKNLQMRKSVDRPENTRATEQYSQMLLLLWAGIFKEKLGFKEFLLVMTEYAKMRAEKEERKMQVPPWVSQRQRE
jgi:fructose-1,6-bisphosphatase